MNNYPLARRTIQLSSYSRQQAAQFMQTESRSGKQYRKRIASNQPTIRSIGFTFMAEEAQIFLSWFNNRLKKGFLPFDIDLETEWGVQTLTCQFMPDSLLNASRPNSLQWTYTAQIMIPDYKAPSYIPDDIDLYPEYLSDRGYLDTIINTQLNKVT